MYSKSGFTQQPKHSDFISKQQSDNVLQVKLLPPCGNSVWKVSYMPATYLSNH